MAALSTVPQHNSLRKPPIGKTGVLTLHGFGIKVRVQSAHLEIEDGVGMERRKIKLARVGHGLKRLVVIGSDGYVSLQALNWLASQGVSFIMLERNGKVLCVTGPVKSSEAKLRRAQALAAGNGPGLEIARALIDAKITAQAQVLRERLNCGIEADVIESYGKKLALVESFEEIRNIEANAASFYFRECEQFP
jgi:CRISPR/Cas system-associated endonuclease Cas1